MNPQRLLQIQQAANPSLRAAATPASILQGGSVTPQYSVSPQGNNFNPQAQQINYMTPVSAPYRLSGPVQVAHPAPLYVGSPAGSVINQGSGQTSLAGFTPGPSVAHSVINTTGGVAKSLISPFGYLVNTDIINPARELLAKTPVAQQQAVQKSNISLGLGPQGNHLASGFRKFGGNTAQIALMGAGGPLGKAAETLGAPFGKIVGSVAGKTVGKGVARVVGDAAVGAPVGTAYNLANATANNDLTKKNAKQVAKSGFTAGGILGGAFGALSGVAKAVFTPAERKVLSDAGIGRNDESSIVGEGSSQINEPSVAEPTPVENVPEPTSTTKKSPKPTPAEATPKGAGAPSRAEPVASAPRAPLTPAQEQILKDFPNGLDKPAMSLLKKQGFADHPTVLNEIKQQVVDAHAAANPDVPRQAIEDAVNKGKAPPIEPIAKAETQKAAQETTGKVASEAPSQFSDIPTLASKEGKASKTMSLEYRANKIGESGRNFVQAATDARVNALKYQQGLEDIAKPFHDLSPEEQSLAVDVKEGRATSDDPRIQAGVQALKDMYSAAHKGATDAGLDIGNKGDTYFNHTYPKGYFDKPANLNAAVKHLVDSGQAADKETALRMMNKYTSDGNFKPNTFGNFKAREADLPGYLKNSEAVHTYTRGAAKNIAQAEQFGPNGEHLTQHLVDAINNSEDAGALKDVMNAYMHPKTPNKFTSALQKPLNVVYLTKAAVSHIPQLFANTGSEVGFSKLGKAIMDTKFDAEAEQLIHDSGLKVSHGKAGNVYDKSTAPGLNPILQKYREVSGVAGKNAAEELASKGDVAGLNKMQVIGPFHTAEDGSIALTKDQQIQAMHHMADKHIGTDDVIQSPAWTQGSVGHATSQFQRAYTFKQGERIINMVKDAAHGNAAPLARYLVVAAPLAGTSITVAKNEIKNPGGNPLGDRGIGNFGLDVAKNSGVESLGFGLPEKAINAARFNFNTDARYQNVAGAIAPGAGIVVETGQNVDKALRGNSLPLKKQGFGMVPVGGKALANKFAPSPQTPYNTPNFQPKTVADLKALNAKTNKDFVSSLSPSDKKSFTDNKGNFIDYNTIKDAHNKGIVSDDQFNHYLALEKVRSREEGNTKYTYNNPDLDAAHASGKISDDQYNLIKQYDQHNGQSNADLTAEGKRKLASRGGDQVSKQINQKIADTVNAAKPPGLNNLTADPDLAKSYVNFIKTTAKDAAKAPEDQETAIDYQDRTIKFWAQAAKDGAPSNVQSVYRDGGNKAAMFLKQGKATKDDINQAVGLDNMLLASGIITTPKFSKKWRADNGYPAASDFMEGGAHYGTAGVGQYLSNGNNSVVATGKGGSGGGGFGNGNTTALNDGSGIFSSVNKKTGAVSLKNVASLNGSGTTSGVVDPDTGLFISKPTGIKQLLNTKDTTFKSPGINLPAFSKPQKAPKLKSFAAPDVRGAPRQQRAVPIRFQRAKFN